MSLVTNTVTRYDATKSVREDFADVIYNISPTDCPLMSNIGRDSAKQTFTEWQTDALASPNTGNAVIIGAVRQLKAEIFREWRPEGLRCTLQCGLSRL